MKKVEFVCIVGNASYFGKSKEIPYNPKNRSITHDQSYHSTVGHISNRNDLHMLKRHLHYHALVLFTIAKHKHNLKFHLWMAGLKMQSIKIVCVWGGLYSLSKEGNSVSGDNMNRT